MTSRTRREVCKVQLLLASKLAKKCSHINLFNFDFKYVKRHTHIKDWHSISQ